MSLLCSCTCFSNNPKKSSWGQLLQGLSCCSQNKSLCRRLTEVQQILHGVEASNIVLRYFTFPDQPWEPGAECREQELSLFKNRNRVCFYRRVSQRTSLCPLSCRQQELWCPEHQQSCSSLLLAPHQHALTSKYSTFLDLRKYSGRIPVINGNFQNCLPLPELEEDELSNPAQR